MKMASDDWETPKWLLQLLFWDTEFFDPCPVGGAGGLEAIWPTSQVIFINPPFSNPSPWVKKAASHNGPVVMLLPVDPTTRWWTFSKRFEIILIGSRLHFSELATYARQTLCIWRKNENRERKARRAAGIYWEPE
jgi:DNA N-6-adenine-methyltransferase (Dam)